MLSLREKIIVLYATAPPDFSATRRDLRRKYRAQGTYLYMLITRLVRNEILQQAGGGREATFVAGPAIREEVGGTAV